MTIALPSFLGNCLTRSYGYRDHDVDNVIMSMESGSKRHRQRTKNTPSDFNAVFIFTEKQLSVFEYFTQEILESRTLEFEMTLRTGQGNVTHTVKFTEPESVQKIGKMYEVSCSFETSPQFVTRTYEPSVLKTLVHDASNGTYNSLVMIDSTHFMLAYTSTGDIGIIKCFEIDSEYNITAVGTSLTYDATLAWYNSLVMIDSTHFILAYTGADEDGFVQCFTIDESYNVSTVGTGLEHATIRARFNSLAMIDSTHFMLAYGDDSPYNGVIKVFEIDGSYNVTQIKSLAHDTRGYYNSLVKIDSTHFMLAYAIIGDSKIASIEIDGSYNITVKDVYIHDTIEARSNSLVMIDSTHFMLAYDHITTYNAQLKCFSIDGAYQISPAGSRLTYDSTGSILNRYPSLVKIDDTNFMVAYNGENYDGFMTMFEIDSSYNPSQSGDSLEYAEEGSRFNSLVKINGNIYILAYASASGDGTIETFNVT